MKKILLSIVALVIYSSIFGQSVRTPLYEEFTGSNCPPCATSTPFIDERIALNEDRVVQIRYQVPIPVGPELMYNDNPSEVSARQTYYNNGSAPDPYLDGVNTDVQFPQLLTQAELDARLLVDAPVLVTVSHTLAADERSVDVTVQIINEGTDVYSVSTDKLRVALTESVITWSTPPGSTDLTHFEGVLKTFFTTPAGMDVPEIAAGETWEMTWTEAALPNTIYDISQIEVVAFIQDDFNKRVVNSASSIARDLSDLVNLGVENTSEATGGLCDYAFTPTTTVINTGRVDVADFDVVFSINGVESGRMNVTSGLAVGGSMDITFDEVQLPSGNNAVSFEVVAEGDIVGVNDNISGVLAVGKIGDVTPSIKTSFEGEIGGEFPTNMIIDASIAFLVADQASFGGNSPLGGYGMSDKSVTIPFYFWQQGTGTMTVLDQIGITADAPALTFDHAYTSFGGSNDAMSVQISTNCGDTFTTLWSQSGSDLATAPELNSQSVYFTPSTSQWRTTQVDLSDYIGETVVLRFLFITAFGDMLYIDNINTQELSAIDELDADESIAVYPNPATDVVTIDFDVNEASDVNIRMINTIGETVLVKQLSGISGRTSSNIELNDLNSGVYYLHMTVGDKEVVRRFTVAK